MFQTGSDISQWKLKRPCRLLARSSGKGVLESALDGTNRTVSHTKTILTKCASKKTSLTLLQLQLKKFLEFQIIPFKTRKQATS